MLKFEYDPAKSQSNAEKHGIDFEQAKALWHDCDLLEIPALTEDEPRYLVIGRLAGKYWTGVITYRGDIIRLISVRRARKKEIELYES